MGKESLSNVRNWLIKAKHDLLTAKKLSKGEECYLDTAIYHCQQAAEKAVKGYLILKDHRPEKTHDLQALVVKACKTDEIFSNCLDAAELLTPYATEYRYPGEFMEPEQWDFDDALDAAESLYNPAPSFFLVSSSLIL